MAYLTESKLSTVPIGLSTFPVSAKISISFLRRVKASTNMFRNRTKVLAPSRAAFPCFCRYLTFLDRTEYIPSRLIFILLGPGTPRFQLGGALSFDPEGACLSAPSYQHGSTRNLRSKEVPKAMPKEAKPTHTIQLDLRVASGVQGRGLCREGRSQGFSRPSSALPRQSQGILGFRMSCDVFAGDHPVVESRPSSPTQDCLRLFLYAGPPMCPHCPFGLTLNHPSNRHVSHVSLP
ncbi:hypothetical protein B0J13DRAFT_16115 [Dactylonectria estremocensis]|uniref:Uncharacterized protein n=1 Tax=Dactylonectria estremocensis TaxID=1079267 RepID=A0A9P9FJJ8_9HYPO|nr:hypothetical protein B0J13DRAFT_16115 [Dactylonectria estremocensis]